jgi:hypothetical protein
MIHVTLHNLYIALVAVAIRDLWCYCAAQIFCWRKRRETQREAARNRELRQLGAELAAREKAEEKERKQQQTKIAAASKVPFPQLVGGPLIITARSRDEVYMFCRQISSNIASGQNVNNFSESSFEEN